MAQKLTFASGCKYIAYQQAAFFVCDCKNAYLLCHVSPLNLEDQILLQIWQLIKKNNVRFHGVYLMRFIKYSTVRLGFIYNLCSILLITANSYTCTCNTTYLSYWCIQSSCKKLLDTSCSYYLCWSDSRKLSPRFTSYEQNRT